MQCYTELKRAHLQVCSEGKKEDYGTPGIVIALRTSQFVDSEG